MNGDLKQIRGVADYQFGRGSGDTLFTSDVEVTYSQRTGKVRHIFCNGTLLATFRPNDGIFTLTIAGALRLVKASKAQGYTVIVNADSAKFVADGRNVFSKHVLNAGESIRPGDEVIVLDEKGETVGVGRALLTRNEMYAFKSGVAVKVRRGNKPDT